MLRTHSRLIRPLIFFLFVVAATDICFALEPNKAITQYAHRIWETKDGLPVNAVTSITQSDDGYLWLATAEGAVRYDGRRFVVFNKQNFPALRTNQITVVASMRDGAVWFGTMGQGAVRFHDGKADLFTKENGLAGSDITAIYEAKDGTIWFGTRKNGLSRYKNGVFTNFLNDELAQATVWNFAETSDGSLWVGTNRLPLRYQKEQFRIYTKSDGLTINSSSALFADKKGRLWIGGSSGVNLWENETFSDYTGRVGLRDEIVMAVYEDSHENIWIGTSGGGIIRFRDEKSARFKKADGLSSDEIVNLYEDREGSLWIGTESGINQFYNGTVTAVTTSEGLADNSIGGVVETSAGEMWFCTSKGLSRLFDGKIKNLSPQDGMPDSTVGVLGTTTDGALWAAMIGGGIYRFAKGGVQRYGETQGVPEKNATVIYEDSQQQLWVATVVGLLRWRSDEKKLFTVADGLADELVRALLESRDGAMWVGTINGLQRFDGNGFAVFTTENGLPDNKIRSLHEDENGVLWIATDGGLARMGKNNQFFAFNSQDGLYQDVIHSILSDDKGNLWMSSNAGIFRVRKDELEQFARGEIQKFESVIYDVSDGMKTREANGGAGISPAGWRARDGRLWFATEGGAVVIDPNNLYENRVAPQVVVEEVFFNEKPQSLNEKLNVLSGANRVDFHFTAPSFRAPEKLKFQYQLVGYDNEWHNAETGKRQVSYTNLPPGNYTFRVKAANESGIWNETGANLAMYVAPRFYQTWWFYLLCALSVVGAGFLVYSLRLRQIKQRFALVLAERTRIAREIHDTLAQNLLATTLQLEAAEEKLDENTHPAVKNHLEQARSSARKGLNEARESISNLRQQPTVKEKSLINELENFTRQVAGETNLNLKFKVTGKPSKMSETVEHNFFRIGQEAVNNAVKHSSANNILVELAFNPKIVRLQIMDDGCGFDKQLSEQKILNGKSGSYGLLGLKERANIIGANFLVETEKGKGTTITATIKNHNV